MSAITNASKPSTSFINSVKASFAELWSTILTSWASETRTWAQCVSLFTDSSKPTTVVANVAKPS